MNLAKDTNIYKTKMKTDNKLYGVLFHYSHYRKKWACFSSDQKREYFNGNASNVGYGETVESAFYEYENN